MSKLGAKVKRHDKSQREKIAKWIQVLEQRKAQDPSFPSVPEIEHSSVQDLHDKDDQFFLNCIEDAQIKVKVKKEVAEWLQLNSSISVRPKYFAYIGLAFFVLWLLSMLVATCRSPSQDEGEVNCPPGSLCAA